ncbi:hypothetical protein HY229_00760 [Candidatus Acetothermia bacterium]|nr:hypothetical protein [Candidatus Acetothermia bacterium]MBI3642621.1 hypothetical protein [Candidatus Acetothermia bacterium]
MSKAKVLSLSVFLIGVFFLSACGMLSSNSTSTGSNPPGAPKPGQLYIPPTTKVLDPDSRTALQSFGKEGNLVFSHSNDLLASLAAGDVVVSEPAAAAPSGLLRKVVSTETKGGQFIVHTSDALLQDAIPQGTLDFTRHLDPKDAVPGQSLPSNLVHAASWSIPFNTDFGSSGHLTLSGTVMIDPTMTLNIHIICTHWEEVYILGVDTGYQICTSTGLDVTSSLQLNEQANVTLSANASYSVPDSWNYVPISTITFTPITFFVGYVPVVLTPEIVIYVGLDGSVTASLSVSATQTAALMAGFHYAGGTFNNLSSHTGTFAIQNPTYQATLDVEAYAGATFQVYLYGLAGPYVGLQAGPEFEASMTGILAASSQALSKQPEIVRGQTGPLLWRLDGCIKLKVGISSITILGHQLQYDNVIYEDCSTFASHENEPPTVSITAPTTSPLNSGNLHQNLIGVVSDPEGGPVTCSWSSSLAADHLSSTSCNDSFTFPGYGSRTLTLTGTDQAGASTSATVSINLRDFNIVSGPKVEICCALETGFFDVDQPVTLKDPNDLGESKSRIEWAFNCCQKSREISIDQPIGTGNPVQWTPSSIKAFNGLCGTIGTGTITLTVTDPEGKSQKATVDITLVRTSCSK